VQALGDPDALRPVEGLGLPITATVVIESLTLTFTFTALPGFVAKLLAARTNTLRFVFFADPLPASPSIEGRTTTRVGSGKVPNDAWWRVASHPGTA